MAVAGNKAAVFTDEKAADRLKELHQQFPEIPVDVVSCFLQKNDGNMSRSIEDLEQASALYMYGDFVGHETPPPHSTMHTTIIPGTDNNVDLTMSHFHEPGQATVNRDSNYSDLAQEVDPDKTPQSSYTSWASLETGVSEVKTPTGSIQKSLHFYEEPKHVSLVTVDMKPSQMTTDVSIVPRPSEAHACPMQSSCLSGKTNGLEPNLNPQDYPFEPRPLPTGHENQTSWHLSELSRAEEASARSQRTVAYIQPAELQVQPTSQISTSYLVDHPKPSSPATRPKKSSRSPVPIVASYNKANECTTISLKTDYPGTSTSSIEGDAVPLTEHYHRSPGFSEVNPSLPDEHLRGSSRNRKRRNLVPPQPGRSLSKEKEDEAYTEALLMHQRARFERLCKEMEEERRNLNDMREQTANMEREVADKHNHRSPFPKPDEISKLREQKRQLQIDIECMNREIELHKSQGLMDLTQANSFYGNMGSTGAPGPVPPMSPNNRIPENPPFSPSYDPSVVRQEPDETQMWSCSACTLLNHPALDKCECCEMPRDK